MLTTQGNLAVTYEQLGRHEESLRMRQEVYSGRLRLNGKEHEETLRATINYASSLNKLRRFEEAKRLLRKPIPVARRVLGEGDEITLKMRLGYASSIYYDSATTLDDLREAVTTLEAAERTARRVLGGSHLLTVDIEDDLRKSRVALRARETPLRFKVGSRVECCMGTNQWEPGTVIKLWYFTQRSHAPYQVELDEGNLIWAPEDSDRYVRRAP